MNHSFTHFGSLLLLFFIAHTTLLAQSNSVTGRIADAQDNQSLPGAHISAVRTTDQFQRDAISDERGFFWIKELPDGPYQIQVTFLGYQKVQLERR